MMVPAGKTLLWRRVEKILRRDSESLTITVGFWKEKNYFTCQNSCRVFLFLTEILLWVLWCCSAWVSVNKRIPPCLPVSADQRSYLWLWLDQVTVFSVSPAAGACVCMCSPVALEREMELPLPSTEYVKLALFCHKWRAHMWTIVTIPLTCSNSGTITWLWDWTLSSSCFLVVLKAEFSKETDWTYFYLLQCAFTYPSD